MMGRSKENRDKLFSVVPIKGQETMNTNIDTRNIRKTFLLLR